MPLFTCIKSAAVSIKVAVVLSNLLHFEPPYMYVNQGQL